MKVNQLVKHMVTIKFTTCYPCELKIDMLHEKNVDFDRDQSANFKAISNFTLRC